MGGRTGELPWFEGGYRGIWRYSVRAGSSTSQTTGLADMLPNAAIGSNMAYVLDIWELVKPVFGRLGEKCMSSCAGALRMELWLEAAGATGVWHREL